MPDIVMKSASRMDDVRNARSQISRLVAIVTVYLDVKANRQVTPPGCTETLRREVQGPALRRLVEPSNLLSCNPSPVGAPRTACSAPKTLQLTVAKTLGP